jgi:ribonuclease P protein component
MKKEYRIKKSKEIEDVLKNKRYAANPYFTIYIKENNENHHFRYAISVNKKIGKAVVRNRLKRQVRSIISQINIKDNIDVFIIVRSKVLDIDFNEMNKQILYLLRKQKTI